MELSSRYEFSELEKKWYEVWEKSGSFKPESIKPAPKTKPFCIVIPPPNITGQLHVGHALTFTIQDVLVRDARKRGQKALWLPGTDHAGIATQAVVEKLLKQEGTDRLTLGREKFIERVWEWKEKYGSLITQQMRTLGLSVEWGRERFTMDEGLTHAVRTVFVDLYKKGLIYRDTRMIHWDPASSTVLSDLEVDYDENYMGEFYSFAYKLTDGSGEIVIATTRPETMLGDTAIAVHPEDSRYKKLIGKTVDHPFLDRKIRIIADSILVDPEFGTGAVKVTPAHDTNDYDVGKRHGLEFITIFDLQGRINSQGGKFQGQDRFEARKAIKQALSDLGLERGSKPHKMAIGKSQRSGAIVEPMISTQWFVSTKPLAEKSIGAVEKGKIKFFPPSYSNLFFAWMRGIREWCISRQLWWGHQIPAWHCSSCNHVTVSVTEPKKCEECGSKEIKQDSDVLDTWFSSGLWPFSTLGWPAKTKDLATFYPNTVLVTAHDIIFFWVARMIMLGLYTMKKEPFGHVYIHGLMRDEQGRKISKSLGNNIDPADVIKVYGADAYRFFLMATLSEGKDSTYSENRLKGYQNFANKVWNSTRFVLMNLPDTFRAIDLASALTAKPAASKAAKVSKKGKSTAKTELNLEQEDWWILHRLNETLIDLERNMREYKIHLATENIYNFIWNEFCDWYIEFIKPRMFGKMGDGSAESAKQTVLYVLEAMLSMLNPFMPYITEEIQSYLNAFHKDKQPLLILKRYPQLIKLSPAAKKSANSLETLQSIIGKVRNMRAELGVAPDKKVQIIIKSKSVDLSRTVSDKEAAILRLSQAETVQVDAAYVPQKSDAMETFEDGQVYLPVSGLIDFEKEKIRIQSEMKQATAIAEGLEKRLSNSAFVDKAPADVVAKEKAKLKSAQDTIANLKAGAERLGLQL